DSGRDRASRDSADPVERQARDLLDLRRGIDPVAGTRADAARRQHSVLPLARGGAARDGACDALRHGAGPGRAGRPITPGPMTEIAAVAAMPMTALAQEHHDSPADEALMSGMDKMNHDLDAAPMTGNADHDFV